MDEKIKYWIELSDYDFDTAKAMLTSGRFLYVGFMCHQVIEKLLKAYWQFKFCELPPKTHNLAYLSDKLGILDAFSNEHIEFIDELEPLNIQSRYPEHSDLLSKRFDQKYAEKIYHQTQEVQLWIKQRLLKDLKTI